MFWSAPSCCTSTCLQHLKQLLIWIYLLNMFWDFWRHWFDQNLSLAFNLLGARPMMWRGEQYIYHLVRFPDWLERRVGVREADHISPNPSKPSNPSKPEPPPSQSIGTILPIFWEIDENKQRLHDMIVFMPFTEWGNFTSILTLNWDPKLELPQ